MLAIVGVVNVIIVRYSVEWWSSLHQGQTLLTDEGPRMSEGMLAPLLVNLLGFTLIFGGWLLRRVRTEVLFRERRASWVRKMLTAEGATA